MGWLGDVFDGVTYASAMGLAVNQWGQWRSYFWGYRDGREDAGRRQ